MSYLYYFYITVSGLVMRVPIYEAVAHYKKNNELPYTEYFGLGDFSTKDLAENAIMLAKNFLGLESFVMKTFILRNLF